MDEIHGKNNSDLEIHIQVVSQRVEAGFARAEKDWTSRLPGGSSPTDTSVSVLLDCPHPAPFNSLKMNMPHRMPPIKALDVLYKHYLNLITDP